MCQCKEICESAAALPRNAYLCYVDACEECACAGCLESCDDRSCFAAAAQSVTCVARSAQAVIVFLVRCYTYLSTLLCLFLMVFLALFIYEWYLVIASAQKHIRPLTVAAHATGSPTII